ncbi:MAG: hypothetical protein CVU90_08495 [Firmicutes bacterium HGW-Firmicutes-15]|nr:MAG: hypothetical protein CVU90_08495 [Firmicutes bacterium HGW-Firmicutes-15]
MEVKAFVAFWTDVMGSIRGKKAIQKLVYFSKVLGIPFDNSYKMHYFGPYSETVAQEILDAEKADIINCTGSYVYYPGSQAESIRSQYHSMISDNIDLLSKLIELFGDMSPSKLELYATTHYVDNIQKHLYNNYDKEEIVQAVKNLKGTKFEIIEIQQAYNDLEDWGLLHSIDLDVAN